MVNRRAVKTLALLLVLLPGGCALGHRVEMLRCSRPSTGHGLLVVRADLPAGKLQTSMGRPGDLYNLSFSYCRDHFQALCRFEPEGSREALPQASLLEIAGVPLPGASMSAGAEPNLMNLLLRPGVPLDLRFSVGQGEMDLDLTALGIERLTLHTGGGPANVRFEAGNSRELEALRVVAGEGPVRLAGMGWGRVRSLEFHGGAGGAALDWTGPGPEESAAFLDPGTGSLHLSFPADLGVALSGRGVQSSDLGPGFHSRGTGWVSAGWEKAERHLTLVLDPGEGRVEYSWKP